VVLEDGPVEVAGRHQRDDDHRLRGALEAVDGVDGHVGPATDLRDLRAEGRDDADVVRVDPGRDVGVDDRGDALGLTDVSVAVALAVGVDEPYAAGQFGRERGGVDAEVGERLAGHLGGRGPKRAVVELRGGERLDPLAHAVLPVEHDARLGILLDEPLEEGGAEVVLGADDGRKLLVVAHEDEPVGAVDRGVGPRLREL